MNYSRRGLIKPNATFIAMLGDTKLCDLTPAQIRAWHRTLYVQVGPRTANAAKKLLRAALCLTAEDYAIPVCSMPTRLGVASARNRKPILGPSEVGRLLEAAAQDMDRGLYYAFP